MWFIDGIITFPLPHSPIRTGFKGKGMVPSGDMPVGVALYICQHPSNNSNPKSKISLLFNARPPNMKFPGAKHVKLPLYQSSAIWKCGVCRGEYCPISFIFRRSCEERNRCPGTPSEDRLVLLRFLIVLSTA